MKKRIKSYIKWTVILGLSGTTPLISAYTPMVKSSGGAIKWHGARRINLAGNPSNRSGIRSSFLFGAVVEGLQRWTFASGQTLRFDYWQGTNKSVYEPNSEFNGLSSLYFSSQTGRADPGVVGLTEVWYDPETGEILETDISLNDIHFRFSESEGSGGIYLSNVVTHELGHAFGLSHSGLLDASMLYVEARGQVSLHCDDQAGIKKVYGATSGRGQLSGRVVGPSGQSIFGAHVVVIDVSSGEQMASGLTAKNGSYAVGGLLPGRYYVMAEPFLGGSSALPPFYSSMTRNLCGGFDYSRAFASQDGFNLDVFNVRSGRTSSVGLIRVGCGSSSSMASVAMVSPETANGGSTFGFAGDVGEETVFPLELDPGTWTFSFLDYRLLSQINSEAELRDVEGNVIEPLDDETAQVGESATDQILVFPDLDGGAYDLVISSQAISSYNYPAYIGNQERAATVLVSAQQQVAGIESLEGSDQLHLFTAAPYQACQQDEGQFPNYRSPPGGPVRRDLNDGIGFCGWLRTDGGDGSSGGSPPGGPSASAIVGWSIPWLLALLFGRLTVFHARRLSRGSGIDRLGFTRSLFVTGRVAWIAMKS